MDLYAAIDHYFSSMATFASWSTALSLFRRVAANRPPHWRLPALVCQSVGGYPEQAIPAVTAIACLHISIILIDDLLDADPRGEHQRIGMPAVANLASAFQAAAFDAITCSTTSSPIKVAVLDSLVQAAISTAFGQEWDSRNPASERAYWQLVQAKSCPFFATIFHIGARMGGASPEIARQMQILGNLYGEIVQIYDDLGDALASPANPDWLAARASLPMLYASLVEHPDREHFLHLRQKVKDPKALNAAQTILLRCGAVSYCVDQILYRANMATNQLASIPLREFSILETMFHELARPVEALLAAANCSKHP